MPARTPCTVAAALLFLALGMRANAEPPAAFLEAARGHPAEDQERVPAIRADLERRIPDLYFQPLPPCPLRSALAKALMPSEVRTRLVAALAHPDRLARLVDNLAGRRDLAALVMDSGAYAPLEETAPRLLCGVAANALLDGDLRMVLRLLEGPAFQTAAETLSELPHAEGLQTLADVVSGAVPIAEVARHRLAGFQIDVGNERPARPLGPERTARLTRTAATDPDPALRALAARILLRADDPTFAAATVRAFVDARSAHFEETDWHALGKSAPAPVTDASVAIEDRLTLLESWLLWTWIRAERDPASAEAWAAALRPALASAEPRFRGEAILLLVDHPALFVTTTHGRQRAVPSFLAILDDLEAGRPGDPPPLVALGRAAAARLRAGLAAERGYPQVRIEERPLAAEASWRPAPPTVETALAGLIEGVDGLDKFEAALGRVGDVGLPVAARRRLFQALAAIAQDGVPLARAEDEDDPPADPRYFDRLALWIVRAADTLDDGLAEVALRAFAGHIPEGREDAGWAAFDRALAKVREPGARQRLVQQRVRR